MRLGQQGPNQLVLYFNPRIPCGMRLPRLGQWCRLRRLFQSTHPMRDATCTLARIASQITFQSTHPMRDATLGCLVIAKQPLLFQSTHPMRDATSAKAGLVPTIKFQSTHPMRDATSPSRIILAPMIISIHASHAGCDQMATHNQDRGGRISIHASHAGCDTALGFIPGLHSYFNPRIPCGMRRTTLLQLFAEAMISIHASHAGCDDPKRSS